LGDERRAIDESPSVLPEVKEPSWEKTVHCWEPTGTAAAIAKRRRACTKAFSRRFLREGGIWSAPRESKRSS
jgi:hypothetical protein